MRKALGDIEQIDHYLRGDLSKEQLVSFQQRLILDPEFEASIQLQKSTYLHIKKYAREALKEELNTIHDQLWKQAAKHIFRKRLTALWKKLG